MLSSWPILVYAFAVVALAAVMIGLSALLGERHRERATGEPFESGIAPTHATRGRFSAQFYIVALLFVIFDLEVVFLFAWAVAAREAGWAGYAGIAVFVFVLLVALIYELRQGALDWRSMRSRR